MRGRRSHGRGNAQKVPITTETINVTWSRSHWSRWLGLGFSADAAWQAHATTPSKVPTAVDLQNLRNLKAHFFYSRSLLSASR